MGRKYKKYVRKPDQTHTRKRRQAQGTSGKYMQLPDARVMDLRLYLKEVGGNCLLRRETCQTGNLSGRIWKVARHNAETNERYYRKVVELFWEDTRGRILAGEQLKRTCKTAGCVNEQHYVLIKREERIMVNDAQARGFYNKAMKEGEAILPLGDEQRARQLRMNMYTRRARWKRHDPMYFAMVENYGLFLEDGNLVCRKHGVELDSLFAAAGLATEPEYQKPIELVEREIKEKLEQVEKEERPDPYKPYATKIPEINAATPGLLAPEGGQTCFTYDECLGKVNAEKYAGGPVLTEEEKEILKAGPLPERRG